MTRTSDCYPFDNQSLQQQDQQQQQQKQEIQAQHPFCEGISCSCCYIRTGADPSTPIAVVMEEASAFPSKTAQHFLSNTQSTSATIETATTALDDMGCDWAMTDDEESHGDAHIIEFEYCPRDDHDDSNDSNSNEQGDRTRRPSMYDFYFGAASDRIPIDGVDDDFSITSREADDDEKDTEMVDVRLDIQSDPASFWDDCAVQT
mmetsp:Transcript_7983/g.21588  ORF Transcript_7983/g.21588 Transcript_7983/m.21588 type:complete len:204 (-) Transcript_7983:251-862(-)